MRNFSSSIHWMENERAKKASAKKLNGFHVVEIKKWYIFRIEFGWNFISISTRHAFGLLIRAIYSVAFHIRLVQVVYPKIYLDFSLFAVTQWNFFSRRWYYELGKMHTKPSKLLTLRPTIQMGNKPKQIIERKKQIENQKRQFFQTSKRQTELREKKCVPCHHHTAMYIQQHSFCFVLQFFEVVCVGPRINVRSGCSAHSWHFPIYLIVSGGVMRSMA